MATIKRDDNRVPLFDEDWAFVEKKSITFDGGTANAIGDYDGTGDPFNIFSVTGVVKIKVLAHCTTNLAGGTATLEIGTANDTAEVIAQSTATDIDSGDLWHDATPDSDIEASSVATDNITIADIVGTVGTANITAGVIDFYAVWFPISSDGKVEAA